MHGTGRVPFESFLSIIAMDLKQVTCTCTYTVHMRRYILQTNVCTDTDIWTERYTNAYPQIYPINIVQEEKERAFEKDFERFCPHFVRDSDIEDDSQRITVKNLTDVFKVTAGSCHHHQPNAFRG